MTISLDPSLSVTGAQKYASAAKSGPAAFAALLSAQIASEGEGEEGAGAVPLNTQMASLLDLADMEGDAKSALLLYMMMGSGASANASGVAMSSLSAALAGAQAGGLRYDALASGYMPSAMQRTSGAPYLGGGPAAITPVSASKAVTPAITSSSAQRSAAQYRGVIDQFQVESNPRYAVNKNGHGDTYCNIFLWDVTRAMNAEIPHYVDAGTLDARYYPDVSGARELNANGIYDWLAQKGTEYGWVRVSAEQAQAYANQGMPVVTAWKNPTGGHGHVQVVCPSEDGRYDAQRGVTIAQAGRTLLNYAPITRVYNERLKEIAYYAHA